MTAYRQLVLFVEGPDDVRLIRAISNQLFVTRYDHVQIYQYAARKPAVVNAFLKAIDHMAADCILLGDFDNGPCVTRKKAQLSSRFSNLSTDRIQIVVAEIESWYLAGSDQSARLGLGLSTHDASMSADNITKETLESMRPSRYQSRLEFLIDLAANFASPAAASSNTSFKYFLHKFG